MGKKLVVTGFVFGGLLALLGLTVIIVAPGFIRKFVTSNIKLEPGTDLYQAWLKPPIDVFMNFNLFNLKNPDDFLKGARPDFEEIGPLVYQEYITKETVTDNQNGTISYYERRRYEFRPDLSKYNESYLVTTLNVAPIAILNKIIYFPDIAHAALNAAFELTNDTFIIRKTVSELLFGYEDNLLKTLKRIADKIFKDLIPTDQVGFFIGKNNSIDGYYSVFTGAYDYKKVGLVESWNYLDKMNVWTSDIANMINGTDGTVLPAYIEKDQRLYIFESDLCRSLYLMYNKTENVLNEIEVWTYAPEEKLFAFHTDNPDNEGFCTPRGNCLLAGVLNLTACQAGVPIIMSSPHFLYADPKFNKDVDGLDPNELLHNTYLSVEPTTGILMKANKRLQFNMQLLQDPRVMYPLFWVDENFMVDQKNADKFVSQVQTPLNIINTAKFVLLGLGLALILVSSGLAWHLVRARNSLQSSARYECAVNSRIQDLSKSNGFGNHSRGSNEINALSDDDDDDDAAAARKIE